jgi:hypothetical protein
MNEPMLSLSLLPVLSIAMELNCTIEHFVRTVKMVICIIRCHYFILFRFIEYLLTIQLLSIARMEHCCKTVPQ